MENRSKTKFSLAASLHVQKPEVWATWTSNQAIGMQMWRQDKAPTCRRKKDKTTVQQLSMNT